MATATKKTDTQGQSSNMRPCLLIAGEKSPTSHGNAFGLLLVLFSLVTRAYTPGNYHTTISEYKPNTQAPSLSRLDQQGLKF